MTSHTVRVEWKGYVLAVGFFVVRLVGDLSYQISCIYGANVGVQVSPSFSFRFARFHFSSASSS